MPVSLSELEDAFQMLSGEDSASGFLDTKTGEIFLRSHVADFGELPEDIDESEDYVRLPGNRDVDLGVRLVMKFAREEIPEHFDEIDRIFSRNGADRRFKDLLERIDRLEAWYAYETAATERALREWCLENGIEVEA